MNKDDFYRRNILYGSTDDPYSYAVSLLPPSLHEEYESSRNERSQFLHLLTDSFDNTGKTLMNTYMNYEPAINNYHTLVCTAMFLYGAELMERECAQALGSLALTIANEFSSK